MPPNVTQRFELQRPDLEICTAEAMLRLSLSIAVLYKNKQNQNRTIASNGLIRLTSR